MQKQKTNHQKTKQLVQQMYTTNNNQKRKQLALQLALQLVG